MKPELEQQIADYVENGHELLFMDPRDVYDECIVGIVERFHDTFLLYSRQCVLGKLRGEVNNEDLAEEDAEEFYAFNVLDAWVGGGTPAFLIDDDDQEDVLVGGIVGAGVGTGATDGSTDGDGLSLGATDTAGDSDGATDGNSEATVLADADGVLVLKGIDGETTVMLGWTLGANEAVGEASGLPNTMNQPAMTATMTAKMAAAPLDIWDPPVPGLDPSVTLPRGDTP